MQWWLLCPLQRQAWPHLNQFVLVLISKPLAPRYHSDSCHRHPCCYRLGSWINQVRCEPGDTWRHICLTSTRVSWFSQIWCRCRLINGLVLKQVHPNTGISYKVMVILNSFVNVIFEWIAPEASSVLPHVVIWCWSNQCVRIGCVLQKIDHLLTGDPDCCSSDPSRWTF